MVDVLQKNTKVWVLKSILTPTKTIITNEMKYTSILLLSAVLIVNCSTPDESEEEVKEITLSSKEMLQEAYQLFKEGDDSSSIALAKQVLTIGYETNNDTLIGRALTSLCRNAQRSLDTTRLAELSDQLATLAKSSGNKQWLMYRAHMNAEMWRLIGDMNRAEDFYTESMQLSKELGATGMYTIDHFNKSFVSTAQGDFTEANNLIKTYYTLRREADSTSEDAYGLIALAYLLEQQGKYEEAHEVAVVTRRLFEEQNIFPEPPDEKPLLLVERKVEQELDANTYAEIRKNSTDESVSSLLRKHQD